MRMQVRSVVTAMQIPMVYALPRGQNADGFSRPEPGKDKEKVREMLIPLVKEAVQRQLKEQQDYYKSRPSLAARQLEQIFGAGSMERALTPAVTVQVYEQLEDRIRREWIRKSR